MQSVSAVKNVFNVRVNVLEFLRVKGVSFKSRVAQEFEISCVCVCVTFLGSMFY